MTKYNILSGVIFAILLLLVAQTVSILLILDVTFSGPRYDASVQLVLFILAICGYGLFGLLWHELSKNWKKLSPPNCSLLKSLRHLLPFYSSRIWEGRDGLQALAHGDCDRTTALWRLLAEKDDPEAQYQLGLLYYAGACVEKDSSVAVKLMVEAAKNVHWSAARWLRRSARAGNSSAQYDLAMMYLTGDGVSPNVRRARKLLSAAAAQGHSDAQVDWGRHNIAGIPYGPFLRIFMGAMRPNIGFAIELFRKAAASGNPRGKLFLGLAYETGSGVDEDKAKAFHLVKEAADDGVAWGQLCLARYYWMGETTKIDKNLATHWFEKAKQNIDENTDPDTCSILATSFIEGWCCETDLVQGYCWTAITYRDSPEEQRQELKVLEKRMNNDQVRQAKSLM